MVRNIWYISQEEFLKNERVGWNLSIDSSDHDPTVTIFTGCAQFRRLAFVKIQDGHQKLELVWK